MPCVNNYLLYSNAVVALVLLRSVLICGQLRRESVTSTERPAFGKSYRQRTLDNLLENYDPRIPPNYEEGFPVEVMVQLHITNIHSISESNMDYKIGMFLRQSWTDSRLKYENTMKINALELDSRLTDNIWVPDLFIANEKDAKFHTVTVPNKLMHIYPEGRVQYSIRISATLQCNMDLRKYPLDSQICNVVMESYGYSTETIEFRWNTNPVLTDDSFALAQFNLGEMRTFQCDKEYIAGKWYIKCRWQRISRLHGCTDDDGLYWSQTDCKAKEVHCQHQSHCENFKHASLFQALPVSNCAMNYTCITLEFEMRRNIGYYVTQIYVPSMLIVGLSWVSFWLDMESVPARISLGLLTVLTMTTQSSGARSSLPKVSYIKAIDVWMATCLLFVFAALIEFAFVNVYLRVEKRRRQSRLLSAEKLQSGSDADTVVVYEVKEQSKFFRMFSPSQEKARFCDRLSRTAFPLVFLVFNIIYWGVYTLWIPVGSTFS